EEGGRPAAWAVELSKVDPRRGLPDYHARERSTHYRPSDPANVEIEKSGDVFLPWRLAPLRLRHGQQRERAGQGQTLLQSELVAPLVDPAPPAAGEAFQACLDLGVYFAPGSDRPLKRGIPVELLEAGVAGCLGRLVDDRI